MEVIAAPDFCQTSKADKFAANSCRYASHRIIVERLKQVDPNIPILSEEALTFLVSARSKCSLLARRSVGSPRKFISRNGEFTVNIALIEMVWPVLGVVYAPVWMYVITGYRGQGLCAARQFTGSSD